MKYIKYIAFRHSGYPSADLSSSRKAKQQADVLARFVLMQADNDDANGQ
ncbi:hypothetical protein [Pseudoalteromonas sp. MMG005]|nr:hypothetical protein [Pseudoalteromonas sp. MMG005]MBQ4848461.1 hypothetical protein [Pseudoalteromonas sp. MMG005]